MAGRKTTYADVAVAAGVSVGTVDRLINARGSVQPETEALVMHWARELRLDRALHQRPTRILRLGVLLLNRSDPFLKALVRGLQKAVLDYRYLNLQVRVVEHGKLDARHIVEKITMVEQTCDGVAINAFDDPAIRLRLAEFTRHKPVFTLISDLPDTDRIAYIGASGQVEGRPGSRRIDGSFPWAGWRADPSDFWPWMVSWSWQPRTGFPNGAYRTFSELRRVREPSKLRGQEDYPTSGWFNVEATSRDLGRIASRTGVRLTLNSAAISFSRSIVPGRYSNRQMRSLSQSWISAAALFSFAIIDHHMPFFLTTSISGSLILPRVLLVPNGTIILPVGRVQSVTD